MAENPNRRWLRKWLRGEPHFVIGGRDDPYLMRWYVIPRNHALNVYLHKFCRSDDDRALHDHPWWFVSILLRGGYLEVTPDGMRERRAPSIAFRPAQWKHRVQLHRDSGGERPCWTVIVTGPKRRHWGFWCPSGFVPWEQFTANVPGVSTTGRGCE